MIPIFSQIRRPVGFLFLFCILFIPSYFLHAITEVQTGLNAGAVLPFSVERSSIRSLFFFSFAFAFFLIFIVYYITNPTGTFYIYFASFNVAFLLYIAGMENYSKYFFETFPSGGFLSTFSFTLFPQIILLMLRSILRFKETSIFRFLLFFHLSVSLFVFHEYLTHSSLNYFYNYILPVTVIGDILVFMYAMFITIADLYRTAGRRILSGFILFILTMTPVYFFALYQQFQLPTPDEFYLFHNILFLFYTARKYSTLREHLAISEKFIQTSKKTRYDFLMRLSDEIQTPLNNIIGMADSLMQIYRDPERDHGLNLIRNNGRRLFRILNDIIDYEKIAHGELILHKQNLDVGSLVEGIIKVSRQLVGEKQLEIINHIGKLPPVIADEDRLQQILFILLNNAIKYTDSGRVEVSASVFHPYMYIIVQDTGPGLPEYNLQSVFDIFDNNEIFFSRDGDSGALGLSIVQKLVNLHGGKVHAESRPGMGAVFTFTIPLSDRKIPDNAPSFFTSFKISDRIQDDPPIPESLDYRSSILPIDQRSAKRILLIDDDSLNINSMSAILTTQGYLVLKARSALAALELLRNEVELDLVIFNALMPVVSGFDILKKIREKYPPSELPVILLTGRNRVEDMLAGFRAGANDYIARPFEKDELIARVKSLIQLKEMIESSDLKNRFIANMSHEIRTPINAILGFTELLDATPLNSEQKKYVDTISSSGTALLAILNDILDISKIESGQMVLENVEFSPTTITNNVIRLFEGKASQKNLKLLAGINVKNTYYRGDPSRLTQILVNLISNSIKFTDNGYVRVSLNLVSASDSEKKETLEWVVTDTGIGISDEKKHLIFERFQQGDYAISRRHGGAGLGLSITRDLIHLMDGEIDLISPAGETRSPGAPGTSFFIRIPFEKGENNPDTFGDEKNISAGAKNKLRILLVEDNYDNQLLAKLFLKNEGHSIDLAENGNEAVQLAVQNDYDIILMDLQLPEMDGYEASELILKYKPDQLIIALTANALRQDLEKCLEIGMRDHLTKPFNKSQLLDKIYEWTPD